jgi:hypothetical protein
MRRAIEYLSARKAEAETAAAAFEESYRARSIYRADAEAYGKAIEALMEAPQMPETRTVNLERFRTALRAAGFDQDQASRAIGALMGSMLGRRKA